MNEDFEEFFGLLNARNVEFLVIGGVAYNYYAPPRATKDIDLWVKPTLVNLRRLLRSLEDFDVDVSELDASDLAKNPRVLMLGRAPNRIDLLTRPDGVAWRGSWPHRETARYGAVPISILGIAQLIDAKKAAGRPQDVVDAAKLEKIAQMRKAPTRPKKR